MRISDWSSDVCSSDLNAVRRSEDGPRFGCRDERLAVEAERGRSAGPFLFQRRTILDAELGIARPFRDLAQALRRLDAEMRRAPENFRAPLAELRKNRLPDPRDQIGRASGGESVGQSV